MKERIEWPLFIPALLLVLAIGLSPSFVAGTIQGGKALEIRAEDILLVLFGSIWAFHFFRAKKSKIEQPPLLFPMVAWFSIGFLSTLTNWILGNVEVQRSFFFFLKEIEFFLIYLFLYYHLISRRAIEWVVRVLIGVGVVHSAWILLQMLFGWRITYIYSYTTFLEPEGTSPGGGFLLLLFILGASMFLYRYAVAQIALRWKLGVAVAVTLPVIGILTSGSRSVLIAFLTSLCLIFFLYALRQKFALPIFLGCMLVVLIFGSFLAWQVFLGDSFSAFEDEDRRFLHLDRFVWEFDPFNRTSRAGIWRAQWEVLSQEPFLLIVGHGKSVRVGNLESHNYFLQALGETGLIGLGVFIFLIGSIFKIAWRGFSRARDPFIIGLTAALLVGTSAMLIMSLAAEAFQVVKISEMYWVIIALTMAALAVEAKKPYATHH